MDMKHLLDILPAVVDLVATLSNALQASLDALQEALVPIALTARWEYGQNSSKFMSLSWDIPPCTLRCAALPSSELRHHIQMLWHLQIELDFMVDFQLPSPADSSQVLWLPDGKWGFGMSIQTTMVKSSVSMVTQLWKRANPTLFDAWLSVVED